MKALELGFVIVAVVALSGCETGRVSDPEVVSTTATESTVVTKVVETTTVSAFPVAAQVAVPSATVNVQPTTGCGQQLPASQSVDILQGVKKPCGTIAADAPKFVTP